MSTWQKFVALALGPYLIPGFAAESPQDAARKAMESSIAHQKQAVAAMQLSIEKQRAAIAIQRPAASAGATAAAAVPPEPFFTLSWPALSAACDPLPEIELTPLVQQAAQHAGLDANLLRAVAQQESGFRSCAVSQKGAMGLMQLMPGTAEELGVHDPFDPAESLMSGAHLLRELLDRYKGDTALALGAYNAGPGRVDDAGGVPEIPETIHYIQQILSRLAIP